MREAHPFGSMFNAGRDIGFDGGEDIPMTQTNSQSATSSHRVSGQVNSLRVNFIFIDDPFNGVYDSMLNWHWV